MRNSKNLLDQNPDDRDILLTALSSFTMYSYGFVMEEAEKLVLEDYSAGNEIYDRANKLFNRALRYGVKGRELKYQEFNIFFNIKKFYF